MRFISTPNASLNDKQQNEAIDSVQWLKSWLTARYNNEDVRKALDLDEDSAQSESKYFTDLLDNAIICTGKDAQDLENLVREEVAAGNLHFTEDYLNKFNGDVNKAAESFSMESNNGTLMGVRCNYIQEPIVFITNAAIENNLLSSVVAHECTHLLENTESERAAKMGVIKHGKLANYDVFYLDAGVEVYARAMQFRKAYNLDPNKVYTVEDIAKIRENHTNEKKETRKKVSQPKKKTFSSMEALLQSIKADIPEGLQDRNDLDGNFLNRYTDEQIMHILNDTAAIFNNSSNEPALYDYDALRHDMKADYALNEAKFRTSSAMRKTTVSTQTQEQTPPSVQTELSPEMITRINNNYRA